MVSELPKWQIPICHIQWGRIFNKNLLHVGFSRVQSFGPLLFLIYNNDLSTICNYMMPLLFADVTNLFSSGRDISKVQQEVEADVNKIFEWLKVNKLSLNIKRPVLLCLQIRMPLNLYWTFLLMGTRLMKPIILNFSELSLTVNWHGRIIFPISQETLRRALGLLSRLENS